MLIIGFESAKRTADNSPAIHRWDERNIPTQSVKRTSERLDVDQLPFNRPLHGLNFLRSIPAVNCWAIVIRPLADWQSLLLVQPN
jgi:hypothetical protein